MDAIPPDAAEPMDEPDYDDDLAIRRASEGHLGHAGGWAHGAEKPDQQGTHDVADQDGQHAGHESDLQEVGRGERPHEEGRGYELWREPDGKDAAQRAVTRIGRNGFDAATLDRQVTGMGGHSLGTERLDRHWI